MSMLLAMLDALMAIRLCWKCGVSIFCVGVHEKNLLDSGLLGSAGVITGRPGANTL